MASRSDLDSPVREPDATIEAEQDARAYRLFYRRRLMMSLPMFLLVLSLVCFLVSIWPGPQWQRLLSAGLAALVASMLLR